jgi:curved DNA-binding protein CbpA
VRHNRSVDPFAVLGVTPAASERELAAAYRELAKLWHPDRRGQEGVDRMAEINAAYELLRAGARQERVPRPAAPAPAAAGRLSYAVRRALGQELLEALGAGEPVRLVTPASTWASPRTILAVSDRRLLWLLDDAPVARVRTAALRDVAEVVRRLRRPRRRVATLQLRMTSGRRHSFAELRPHTAAAIERHVLDAKGPALARPSRPVMDHR